MERFDFEMLDTILCTVAATGLERDSNGDSVSTASQRAKKHGIHISNF